MNIEREDVKPFIQNRRTSFRLANASNITSATIDKTRDTAGARAAAAHTARARPSSSKKRTRSNRGNNTNRDTLDDRDSRDSRNVIVLDSDTVDSMIDVNIRTSVAALARSIAASNPSYEELDQIFRKNKKALSDIIKKKFPNVTGLSAATGDLIRAAVVLQLHADSPEVVTYLQQSPREKMIIPDQSKEVQYAVEQRLKSLQHLWLHDRAVMHLAMKRGLHRRFIPVAIGKTRHSHDGLIFDKIIGVNATILSFNDRVIELEIPDPVNVDADSTSPARTFPAAQFTVIRHNVEPLPKTLLEPYRSCYIAQIWTSDGDIYDLIVDDEQLLFAVRQYDRIVAVEWRNEQVSSNADTASEMAQYMANQDRQLRDEKVRFDKWAAQQHRTRRAPLRSFERDRIYQEYKHNQQEMVGH